MSGGLFRHANYETGNQMVTLNQVLDTARFAQLFGNTPTNFTIWLYDLVIAPTHPSAHAKWDQTMFALVRKGPTK